MSDLINRQALCEFCLNTKDRTVDANDIMRFPSAKERTAKVVTEDNISICDNCSWVVFTGMKYCPLCGARLEWE